MSQPRAPSAPPETARSAPRRPRIAIMGEFSAGKSTLTNLLLGDAALPTRVTATQLPPVWLGWGSGTPTAVDLDGATHPVDLAAPEAIDLGATRFLRVERMAGILDLCDLIDFPGISDPNMPAETWERVMPLVDGVIWCTHATQAWRQSEAAFWDTLPETVRANAVLLLTRIDRVLAPRDRKRVLARAVAETDGAFTAVHAVSLTRADGRDSGPDSGLDAALASIHGLVARLSRDLGRDVPVCAADPAPEPYGSGADAAGRIAPRRVRRRAGAGTARLSAEEAARRVSDFARP